MTKLELIQDLKEYDHAFLNPEGVKYFTEPFGFTGTTYFTTDERSKFKGLNLGADYKESDKAEGQSADQIAFEIAQHLGVTYPEMFGRGSRLRVICDAIEKYLIEKGVKE